MLKTSAIGLALGLALFGAANAQICTVPNQLQNSATTDAVQVMGNFNSLANCANNSLAPLASPHFTGAVGVLTTAPQTALSVASTYLQVGQGRGTSTLDTSIIFGDLASGGYQQFYWNHAAAAFVFTAGINTNGPSGGPSAWINWSDGRLKKNIQPLTGGLDVISRLRPVRFGWRSAAERSLGQDLVLDVNAPQIGLIAQEVAAVLPEAVQAPPAGSSQPYGLKEGDLIPVLIAAVQEQQAQINQLKAQVVALQAKLGR